MHSQTVLYIDRWPKHEQAISNAILVSQLSAELVQPFSDIECMALRQQFHFIIHLNTQLRPMNSISLFLRK